MTAPSATGKHCMGNVEELALVEDEAILLISCYHFPANKKGKAR